MAIDTKDLKYFNVAKSLSLLSDFQRTKLGAVVVLKGEVIATGYNRRKTHPYQSQWAIIAKRKEAIYLHAEMSCLIKLLNTKHDLSNAKIYIFRQTKKLNLAIAAPCEICTLALKAFGIKQIYYTTTDGYVEELRI